MTSHHPTATKLDVNGLRVLVPHPNNFTGLKPGTGTFDCTASVISLAMDLLESQSSISVLKSIIRRLVGTEHDVPELQGLKEEDYKPRILHFLRSLRLSFPQVIVTSENGMGSRNGRTNKLDRAGDSFTPVLSAVIEINSSWMRRMSEAQRGLLKEPSEKNKRHFRNLHFRLSITMGHELEHGFQLFLRHKSADHTPPRIACGGYVTDQVGESGRYWEYHVFGGYVDMRDSSNNPLEGMETIVLRDSHGSKVWRIETVVIDGILNREFKRYFPPDMPLTDAEYKKGTMTMLIEPVTWKSNFADVSPPMPNKVQGERELSEAQMAALVSETWLSSQEGYNMSGEDLRAFPFQPRRNPRQVRFGH